jgi:hypothetical protein
VHESTHGTTQKEEKNMKYRKKPVIIDAQRYEPGLEDGFNNEGQPVIHTLEGDHIISPDDWIITGVKNERYPCKNDIFLMTYEPVE